MRNNYKKIEINKNKLSWESEEEYNYRIQTEAISKKVSNGLALIGTESAQNNPQYSEILTIFIESKDELLKVEIPDLYFNVNKYFLDSIKEYIRATNLLIAAVKIGNTKQIQISARHISKGNLFMELSRIEIAEAFDKKSIKRIDLQ